MGIQRELEVVCRIHIRFYERPFDEFRIRLAIFQESRYFVRDIQMLYFLIFGHDKEDGDL